MASLSMKRSLKARQIGLVQTYHKIDASAEKDLGLDAMYVESVEEVSTGIVKITVKEKSCQNVVVGGLVSFTAGAILNVIAEDKESVTIEAIDAAGDPIQADFGITLVHSKVTNYLY